MFRMDCERVALAEGAELKNRGGRKTEKTASSAHAGKVGGGGGEGCGGGGTVGPWE